MNVIDQVPLATFISKYGGSSMSFIQNLSSLKRIHYPEKTIVEHATYIYNVVEVTEGMIRKLRLKIHPFSGLNLIYVGSTSGMTLWQNSFGEVFSVKNVYPLMIEHESFTAEDRNELHRLIMEYAVRKITPVYLWASKLVSRTENAYSDYLKALGDFKYHGWGIVGISPSPAVSKPVHDENFNQIVDFLRREFGDPTEDNGWMQKSLPLGVFEMSYIVAKLQYMPNARTGLTEISYRLFDFLSKREG